MVFTSSADSLFVVIDTAEVIDSVVMYYACDSLTEPRTLPSGEVVFCIERYRKVAGYRISSSDSIPSLLLTSAGEVFYPAKIVTDSTGSIWFGNFEDSVYIATSGDIVIVDVVRPVKIKARPVFRRSSASFQKKRFDLLGRPAELKRGVQIVGLRKALFL